MTTRKASPSTPAPPQEASGDDARQGVPLLNSEQVAEFVGRGFLRFEAIVPDEINALALEELKNKPTDRIVSPLEPELPRYGSRLSEHFVDSPGIGAFLRMPEVQGVIESLVGPDPYYDHHAVHIRRPGTPTQPLHADGIVDTRAAFDIMLMYYPEAVTAIGGGTLIVPGSHLRQVDLSNIARYQNVAGFVLTECPAGSVMVLHQGLWHCGRRSRSEAVRYMFKIRLNARVEQVRLWDTSDLDDPQVRERIRQRFYSREPWFEEASGHVEEVLRTALFRRLCADPSFDEVEARLSRLETQKSPRLRELLP
jgi:hypothetical protein